jgi:ubiquinol-cytochrome c reductase cytochrome b subunit
VSDPIQPPVSKPKSTSRLYRWLDRRTGLNGLLHASLDEPIPGGARLAYVFGSGLLFIFISQVITGLCLALYYVPSAETAHTSVAYITKQVAAGAFLRSLHYYGSSAMIIVLALHFLQTFLYGSFKGRRELLWISGAFLSLLVLGMGFTGYLLPWDQKAYFATAVGTNIVGEVPWIGEWLTRLMRGGDTLGTLTLSRFYVAHVFLIPGMIFLFIGIHIALFRKAGPAGPINEDPVVPKLPPEGFYPRQVIIDMAFALLLMVGLGFLAYFHPVELGPIANPANTQFIPRPEWYYLPMFEWLKFWEGPKVVFGVVIVPGVLALLFFLLPFLDRRLERRPWRRPIPLLAVSIVLVGMIFLGIRSHLDDVDDPSVAAQLSRQAQQEKAYIAAPFHPFIESPGGASQPTAVSGPMNPQVAQGKGVFDGNGCSGCHGETGTGTPAAPTLVGVIGKYPVAQLATLLRNPTPKMRAGGMPAFDLSASDMSALFSYLAALGTSAANVPATYHVAKMAAPAGRKTAVPIAEGLSTEVPHAATPVGAASAMAVAGEQMFQSHACFACHGEGGAGTARVPAMATLIANVSNPQLAVLLSHPNARMRAGGMSPFTGTPEQTQSMIAYLRTLSGPTTVHAAANAPATMQVPPAASENAPAPPPNNPAASAAPVQQSAAKKPASDPGRPIFVANGCAACHGIDAQGTHFAPSLVGVTHKYPGAQMATLLRHPNQKMRNGGMPAVTVNDSQLQQLIAYLATLQPGGSTTAQPTHSVESTEGAAANKFGNAPQDAETPNPIQALPLSPEAIRGKALFQRYSCETCHGVGGIHGTVAAPGLAGTASILPAPMLENLLRHHSKRMQDGGMPLTNMNARDMKAIVAYIRSLPAPANTR